MNKGIFEIDTIKLYSKDENDIKEMQLIFKDLIILYTDHVPFKRHTRYYALSDRFSEPTPLGNKALIYDIQVVHFEGEPTEVNFINTGNVLE